MLTTIPGPCYAQLNERLVASIEESVTAVSSPISPGTHDSLDVAAKRLRALSAAHSSGSQGKPAIRLDGVTHYFVSQNQAARVVDDISFEMPAGQFLAIVGPSGCGKTTVLNMIAGLVSPSVGHVWRNGSPVAETGRDIGYMLARDSLLPWRTAQANIEMGLEVRDVPRASRRVTAERLLNALSLRGLGELYPSQLSQGMRQRVALARTLAYEPAFLLMDEPFAALDAQTRLMVQAEFIRVWEGTGTSVVFVTHDLEEAVVLADRVMVFSARPARILLDIMVPLTRPRSVESARYGEEFDRTHREIWRHLRDEVVRASA
ncbi:MAG: ABC transporter ATP-binding protein [Betaproteobacteria bacterium]|nr:MAG: ABC transporter ATP-binding protein [Betaproteobacteria bacterium]